MVDRIIFRSRGFLSSQSFRLLLLLICIAPRARAADQSEDHYFNTHFQDESQFIVETICTDLAGMFYYTKSQSPLSPEPIVAEAQEVLDAAPENPRYQLLIKFPGKITSLRLEIAMDQPIWDPRPYDSIVSSLAQKFAITRNTSPQTNHAASFAGSTKLVEALLELDGPTLERFNQQISEALTRNFLDRELHEQAALLLGAFGLREASGRFTDNRLALCRMTAHLAFARGLDRTAPPGLAGRLADAVLYTLMNNQRDVLQRCDDLAKSDPQLAPWIRALRTFATGDYRPLRQIMPLSHIERIAFSSAGATLNGPGLHFRDLSSWEFQSDLDAIRLFAEHHYSGTAGYVLFQQMNLELKEIAEVTQLARHEKFDEKNLASLLQANPEGCVSFSSPTQAVVRVISWGHWSRYFQRHLCHAVPHSYEFLKSQPGFAKDAEEWLARYRTLLKGLKFAPLIEIFLARDEPSFQKAIDDGIALTVAAPHLISPELWVDISHQSGLFPLYHPVPNDHISEWHRHDPPAGTVHAMRGRSLHLAVRGGQKNSTERLEELNRMAPYDRYIATTILRLKSRAGSHFKELSVFLEPLLDYSATMWNGSYAFTHTEDLIRDHPARYYPLAQIVWGMNEDTGFNYIQRGIDQNADPATGAFLSQNLIYYYLRKNLIDKAERVATWAGKVPGEAGPRAQIRFLRAVGRVEESIEVSRAFEDHFNDSRSFTAACMHYRYITHDHRYDAAMEKRLGDLFPIGIEKINPTNFTQRPMDGVVVVIENELTQEAGLKRGDVVVAVSGVRIHDWHQYDYARYLDEKPQTTLLIWDGARYVTRTGKAAAEGVSSFNNYNMTGAPLTAASRKKAATR